MKKIRNAFDEKNWESLRQMAHSLKGSAGNIRADDLYAAAQKLETASLKETVKPPMIDKIETALNQVLESIQSLVETPKIEPLYGKERRVDAAQIIPKLKQISEALEIADPMEIKKHIEALKKHLDSSIIQDLENQVNNYDYDKALGVLKRIEGNIRDQLE